MAALSIVPASSAPSSLANGAETNTPPHILTTNLSLYAIEEQILALEETEEMVTEEQRAEFEQAFKAWITAGAEKVDATGRFMSYIESQIALADAEVKRLAERKQWYQQTLEKRELYVVRVLESLGTDSRGKPKKLEGRTVTFSLRKCPASVDVKDVTLIPDDCKTAAVTLPLPLWQEVMDHLELDLRIQVQDKAKLRADVSKTAVKAAIESGAEVSGADLIVGKNSLVRK
jgi:hypothetical protein